MNGISRRPEGSKRIPLRGIPVDLRRALDSALGPNRDWVNAGHAFAAWVIHQWPHGEAFNWLSEESDFSMFYLEDRANDFTDRVLTLAWLEVRYPDVIAFVPRDRILDFAEGACKKLFDRGYWHDPHVYEPIDVTKSA